MGTVANLSVKIGANTQDFSKGLQAVQTEVQGVGAKIGAIFASAGVGILAGELTQLVGKVAGTTGHLADLAAKSGLTAEAVQELDFVARQSGSSFDQISQALALMGNRLVEGDKGAVQAIKALGLNLSELQAMQPDQAFQRIAAAVSAIADPMQRSKLAMDLFGRSGATVLPVLTSNIGQLREQARSMGLVMSNEVVASGDRVGDNWQMLQTRTQSLMATALIPLMDVFSNLPAPVQTLVATTSTLAPTLGAVATAGLAMKLAFAGTAITLGTVAVAFGAVAAAIVAVWGAWKIGNIESVKNGVAQWALSSDALAASLYRKVTGLQQLSPEMARQAISANAAAEAESKQSKASDNLAQQLAKQQAETQKAIEAAMGEEKALAKSEAAKRKAAKAAEDLARKQTEQAASYRDFLNFIGEREIEDVKRANEAKAKSDADYRAFQNQLGEQEKADHAARLQKQAEAEGAWRQTMNEIGEKQMQDEAARMAERNRRWTEFRDHAKQSIDNVSMAMSDSFVRMMTGASSFKEGFTAIWRSIKDNILGLFADLLNSFINSFLKGMLGALFGQQGSFQKAFSGLLGGGGSGLLGGLLGGGGAAAGGAAAGAGGAAAGAGAGGGAMAGLLTNPLTGIAAGAAMWAMGAFSGSTFTPETLNQMANYHEATGKSPMAGMLFDRENLRTFSETADASPSGGNVNVNLNVSAVDAQGVREFVESDSFTTSLTDALRRNRNGLLTAAQDLLVPAT
jgi:hypothetical protein